MGFNPDEYINQKLGAKPFDPDAYISQKGDTGGESLGTSALRALVGVGKAIDSVTGAPMRAGIGAAQNVGSLDPRDWAKAGLSAARDQLGQDPSLAPSGEEIVQKAGVPSGIASKTAGVAMDLAANPLNFVSPIGAGLGKAVDAAKEIPYLGAVAKAPGNLLSKGLSLVSKPSAEAWHTYADKVKDINALLDKHAGEIAPMADELKAGIMGDIQSFKQGLSNQIDVALSTAADKPPVSAQPILDSLYKAKLKINPVTQPADLAEIQSHISTIQQLAPDGTLNARNLFDAKKYLQENGYSSVKKGGQIFYPGDAAQGAAKEASGIANQILRKEVPEIGKANDLYSELHDIQDKMGSLLREGNAAPALAAAGGGTGTPGQTILRRLGDLTGNDYVAQANTLFGARAMNNPDLRTSLIRAGMAGAQFGADQAGKLNVGTSLLGGTGALNEPTPDNAITRRLGSFGK